MQQLGRAGRRGLGQAGRRADRDQVRPRLERLLILHTTNRIKSCMGVLHGGSTGRGEAGRAAAIISR
jgi:hypothetical protein